MRYSSMLTGTTAAYPGPSAGVAKPVPDLHCSTRLTAVAPPVLFAVVPPSQTWSRPVQTWKLINHDRRNLLTISRDGPGNGNGQS
ncbi:hypothetical protein Ae356Ps1_6108 [Pseudonocardia sp. Ae356_Ps1]|nr:hypothetical protein Ae356Ps1_6108 [Pseudonocardia sp. Ae356_Ps1]